MKKRAPLLEKDLKALGFDSFNSIKMYRGVSLDTKEKMRGYSYVLDGSRNGGIFLTKVLQNSFGEEIPCSYFYGKGEETSGYWGGFMGRLSQAGLDEKELESAVIECYKTLIDWFSDESN